MSKYKKILSLIKMVNDTEYVRDIDAKNEIIEICKNEIKKENSTKSTKGEKKNE